ncbi:MAG: FtsW/RodA/SpoVE family cell cycle protein [Oscillospiraceae bacterium]|nr:FtsW/RodA/SpoVE family cell cycle protein [Oscillospiraceae bacterium]
MLIRLREAVKDILRRSDMALLGLCLIATMFGIVLIASATNYRSGDFQDRRVRLQAIGALLGIIAYFIVSNVDIEHLYEKWPLFLLFNFGFIALLLKFGVDDGTGNRAWLKFSWLPMSIQPAEVVKLSYTVLLAKQLAWFRDRKQMKGLDSLAFPAGHAGIMFVWIYLLSQDAGSGLIYLFIYAGMALAAGLAWYWFAAGFTVMGLGVGGLILFDKLPTYWVNRILIIFDHSFNSDIAWQQTRSMLALGSGGLFGQGLFKGIQTQSAGGLPERQTDFIFAVCGEELGMVGCLLIILLEFLIVYRCFQTARLAHSTMDALICIGFGSMLIAQVVINIGMCLFVVPVIGLTLPFFSYGGSSIVTLYIAMGLVSGVRSRTLPDWLRKT